MVKDHTTKPKKCRQKTNKPKKERKKSQKIINIKIHHQKINRNVYALKFMPRTR